HHRLRARRRAGDHTAVPARAVVDGGLRDRRRSRTSVVTRENSLFRRRDFLHLWCAESVSQLGSQVSLLVLPLVAITVLHATTFEVGALSAVEMSPFVLIGLPAGALVDRLPRRPVLVWCDIGRAVALSSIP